MTYGNHLTGVWKLISGEFRYSGDTVTYPWGKDPGGQIVYTADGYMAAQIMNPDRPEFVSRDHMKGTDIEIRAAFEGYQAYYGTYAIDEKEKIVNHRVEGSVFPNLIGHTLKRYYELSGDMLTLRTPPMKMGGKEVTSVLIWQRV